MTGVAGLHRARPSASLDKSVFSMFMELFQSENLFYFIILGVFSFVNSQFDECMINNASQCLSVLPGNLLISGS